MASSSSTSSFDDPFEGVRPLPGWALALVALLTLVAADQAIRRSYHPQGDIRQRALSYVRHEGAADERDLLIMGSCLPEQMMDLGRLQQRLSVDHQVFQLGTASGTGLMWTVLLKGYVPDPAKVDAILIPFGSSDLIRRNVPWESHLMGLASWADVPSGTWNSSRIQSGICIQIAHDSPSNRWAQGPSSMPRVHRPGRRE